MVNRENIKNIFCVYNIHKYLKYLVIIQTNAIWNLYETKMLPVRDKIMNLNNRKRRERSSLWCLPNQCIEIKGIGVIIQQDFEGLDNLVLKKSLHHGESHGNIHKTCLTSLQNTNQDHQEDTIHYILIRGTKIKIAATIIPWQGEKTFEALAHCWWECKVVQPLWEKVGHFLLKLSLYLSTREFLENTI